MKLNKGQILDLNDLLLFYRQERERKEKVKE